MAALYDRGEMGTKPLWSLRALGSFAALSAVIAAACSGSQAPSGNEGTGGLSGWTFLPPASDAAGTPVTSGGAAGAGGAGGRGGTAGTASSAGAGGGAAPAPKPFACGGLVPNQPLITRFDGFMKDRWVSPGNLNGGVYIYPEPLSVKDGEFLRFSDQVTTYAGIGVWFSGCINASQFEGVKFTLSGTLPPGRALRMYAISNRNRDIDEDDGVGACAPSDPIDTWPSCHPPGVVLPVTAEPSTLYVKWADFEDGLPSATTDGSDMLALQWSFDWNDSLAPYDAQLTIDDLSFFSRGEDATGGAGGSGGSGGASGSGGANAGGAGGSGGASAGGAGGSGGTQAAGDGGAFGS